MLLEYLIPKFRADVLNCEFIVIQVDTDVSNEKGFDVSQFDANNQPLTPEVLMTHVIAKLVAPSRAAKDFTKNTEKLFFASVSIPGMLASCHHNKKPLSKPKITGCAKALSYYLLPRIEKTYRCYDKLSQLFKNVNTLMP